MTKDEMTTEQLQTREKLMQFADKEGWESDDTDWFEEGLWSQFEWTAFHDNDAMLIELQLNLKDELLNVILTENESGNEAFIVIKTLENIQETFEKINSFKSTIDGANFREKVNSLFEVTHSIYADDGSNALVKMEPDA